VVLLNILFLWPFKHKKWNW